MQSPEARPLARNISKSSRSIYRLTPAKHKAVCPVQNGGNDRFSQERVRTQQVPSRIPSHGHTNNSGTLLRSRTQRHFWSYKKDQSTRFAGLQQLANAHRIQLIKPSGPGGLNLHSPHRLNLSRSERHSCLSRYWKSDPLRTFCRRSSLRQLENCTAYRAGPSSKQNGHGRNLCHHQNDRCTQLPCLRLPDLRISQQGIKQGESKSHSLGD